MQNIWRLFGLVPKYKSRLIKVLIVNSVLGLSGLVAPYIFRNILNLVVQLATTSWDQTLKNKLFLALATLLGVYLVNALFDYVGERLSDFLFIDIMWEIRKKIFRHLSVISLDYYEQNRSGEIIQRINTGIADFARWVLNIADGILGSALMIIFVVVFLWIKLPWVGLIMTVSLSLNFYWSVTKVIRVKAIRRMWHKFEEKGMGEMNETISQIATVRSFAQEEYKFNRYVEAIDGNRELRIKLSKVQWSTNFYRGVLNGATIVLSLGVVAYGVFRGINTTGDILLVSLYLQQMRGSIGPLSRIIIDTGDLETSAERLTELLDTRSTVVDAPDAVPVTAISQIEFKNVSFHYPNKEQEVLRDISFTLLKGQTLALVGPSGVGKTTITKLLMRFYTPTSGQILVNNQPIETFKQNSIREHIGTVMQDVALFNESIEENLRFARPTASHEEIDGATKLAHADVFIKKLPDGYQTIVGERGVKLSGGEKQRVAIARAVLRNPDLIILDEATSSLDSQSERLVQDGLEKLLTNRTAVIIAHRLSTVRQADKIIVLENGIISESGTHDELAKNKKLYAKLLSLQLS